MIRVRTPFPPLNSIQLHLPRPVVSWPFDTMCPAISPHARRIVPPCWNALSAYLPWSCLLWEVCSLRAVSDRKISWGDFSAGILSHWVLTSIPASISASIWVMYFLTASTLPGCLGRRPRGPSWHNTRRMVPSGLVVMMSPNGVLSSSCVGSRDRTGRARVGVFSSVKNWVSRLWVRRNGGGGGGGGAGPGVCGVEWFPLDPVPPVVSVCRLLAAVSSWILRRGGASIPSL